MLSTLAADANDQAERRALVHLAGRALLPAWKYAQVFPIGQPQASLVTRMYARLRGLKWLARRSFARPLSSARELTMPYDAERAETELASLAESASSGL